MKLTPTLFAATLALGLSACTIVPPRVMIGGPPVAVVAPMAPPPPRIEVIPAPPARDYVWLPGYWHWEGREHRWIDGRWEPHREQEHWVPHRWERDERSDRDQWRQTGGYWRHD